MQISVILKIEVLYFQKKNVALQYFLQINFFNVIFEIQIEIK